MTENQRSVEYLDRIAIQVARVTLAAAYYDNDLTKAIGKAMNLSAIQCNALVRPMSISNKLDLCERILTEGPDEGITWFKKHRRRVKKAFDRRNELIHGTFGHDENDRVSVKSFLGKSKIKGQAQYWGDYRISELANCLVALRDQIGEVQAHATIALQQLEAQTPSLHDY